MMSAAMFSRARAGEVSVYLSPGSLIDGSTSSVRYTSGHLEDLPVRRAFLKILAASEQPFCLRRWSAVSS